MPRIHTSAENHSRSLVKAISYRCLSMSVDFIVAYSVTGNVAFSTGIILFVNGYSTILYYGHERIWANIHWGHKTKHIEENSQKNIDK